MSGKELKIGYGGDFGALCYLLYSIWVFHLFFFFLGKLYKVSSRFVLVKEKEEEIDVVSRIFLRINKKAAYIQQ